MSRARHFRQLVKITNNVTHHFFVLDAKTLEPLMCDNRRRTLVYLDREQAIADAVARFGDRAINAVGMGDENWKLFQVEQEYTLVPRKDRRAGVGKRVSGDA